MQVISSLKPGVLGYGDAEPTNSTLNADALAVGRWSVNGEVGMRRNLNEQH
jgi:hypothetical protein